MAKNEYIQAQEKIRKKKIEQAFTLIKKEAGLKAYNQVMEYSEAIKSKISITTRKNYIVMLGQLCRELKKAPDELTNKMLVNFFNNHRDESPSTGMAYWQALRSYFKDYKKFDRRVADKETMTTMWEALLNNIEQPKPEKRKVPYSELITPQRLQKLFSGCYRVRDKAIISILWETGSRISEVLALRVKDIKITENPVEVQITESKTRSGKRTSYIKTSVPLLRQWLEVHPLKDEKNFSEKPLWVNVEQNPSALNLDAFQQQLIRIAKRSNLKINIYNHLFRYSRINYLYWEMGWDLKKIKTFVGHSKIETTDHYLKIDEQQIAQEFVNGKKVKDMEKERQRRAEEARNKQKTVVCDICNNENNGDRDFCWKCNQALSEEALAIKVEESSKNKTELQNLREQHENLNDKFELVLKTLAKEKGIKLESLQ